MASVYQRALCVRESAAGASVDHVSGVRAAVVLDVIASSAWLVWTVSPPMWSPLRPFPIAYSVVKAVMDVGTAVYVRVRDTAERAWASGASAIA